jgi:hypothetical protein
MRTVLVGFGLAAVMVASGCTSASKGSQGADDDDDDVETPAASIAIEPWSIAPGEDKLWCKTMKMPGAADQVYDVSKIRVTMPEGSHHFILYRSSDAVPDSFGECAEMGDRRFVTGSQTPGTFETQFPEGKAMPLFGGEQLILESHYANASTDTITGSVDVDFFTMPHDKVDDYLQTLLLVYDEFEIPPTTNGFEAGTAYPEIPGVNVWMMSSHTHKRMTNFIAEETNGGVSTEIYQNDDWHAPYQKIFDPPLVGKSNTQLGFRCTWNNETDHPIYFGPTTEDEMCILVITIFPAFDYSP